SDLTRWRELAAGADTIGAVNCEMPERGVAPGGLGRRTKEATMTTKLVALVLLCLLTGTAMAQQATKVTSLMSCGESRQGSSDDDSRACARRVGPYPPTQCTCDCLRTGGLRCDAGEGWKTGNTDARTDLL